MSEISITVPDQDLQQLQKIAKALNISTKDLILIDIKDLLNSSKYVIEHDVEHPSEVVTIIAERIKK